MADMADFDAANQPRYKRAKIDEILESLDGENTTRADALRTALADRVYTSTSIARVLKGWGFDISPDAVQKWRRSR